VGDPLHPDTSKKENRDMISAISFARATAIAAIAIFCAASASAQFPKGKTVDLSYAYDDQTIYWPTEKGFTLEKRADGVTEKGYYYSANAFCSPEHGGTHIDAPIHFFAGRHTVDEIPVDRLMGEGVVVDVSAACAKDRDYRVTGADFAAWEKRHGRIPEGAIVFLRTGFGKFWPDRVKYMGTDERGEQAVAKLHFPGLDPEAAKWLAGERRIKAVGLDTPSIDYGQSTGFETHITLFERNVPALENVANLDMLPEKGFYVIALPVKIRGGSGGPVRIVAILGR
jgi:kynurenine formamidase